ncbi:MAG: hypothetical protein MMC33_001472 [Icmadophila ericetorum]|nr:hypothetical protein [Icmadophila ericetorum]
MSSKAAPVRRNGTSKSPPQSHTSRSTARTSQNTSPIIPTTFESILLAIYPATLILGSIFSYLEPHARAAPYSTSSQSHPSEFAPSYFAKKSNFFNVYFVKIGWFWMTVAFVVFMFMHPSTGPSRSFVLTKRRVQGFLRFGIITLWWIVVTQWYFGPPLIDRGFRLTGGQCELLKSEDARAEMGEVRVLLTSAACKAAKGKWVGGYDISGHVFLLVLGSASLWLEILPVLRIFREERFIRSQNGEVKSVETEIPAMSSNKEEERESANGISVSLAVGGLSWWMLLMTAAYFHTWFEKFTGLLVAFTGIALVYFLPREIPAIREYLGVPGV